MLKLKGLDHFGIEVSDMERSLAFYTRTLGMEFQARFGHMSLMKCGGNELALFERVDLPAKSMELTEPRAGVTGPSVSAKKTSPGPRSVSPLRASPCTGRWKGRPRMLLLPGPRRQPAGADLLPA